MKFNLNIPKEDEGLLARMKEAAAKEGARQGRTVSQSEWVRDAIYEKLEVGDEQ